MARRSVRCSTETASRPCRYLVTTDDLLVMASETGVLDIPPENVLFKERIYPGRIFLLDGDEGRLVGDEEIKAGLSARKPYGRWLEQNTVDLGTGCPSLRACPVPTSTHCRSGSPHSATRSKTFGCSWSQWPSMARSP